MKKTVLTYGFLSGLVFVAMVVSLLLMSDGRNFDRGNSVTYLFNVAAYTMIFLGIRSYREHFKGRPFTFNAGFRSGILIVLIGALCYVITWLVYIYGIDPEFPQKFMGFYQEKIRASGKSIAEIEKELNDFNRNMGTYNNPGSVILYTFLEVFPGGFLVAVLCALLMKRDAPAATPAPPGQS